MNFLKKIASFFARLFSKDTAAKLQKAVEACAPYIQPALAVCETIAKLTPTRADDEIIAAIQHYAVPVLWNPKGDRGDVLREIARAALRQQFPNASDSDINRAVELAVGVLKV